MIYFDLLYLSISATWNIPFLLVSSFFIASSNIQSLEKQHLNIWLTLISYIWLQQIFHTCLNYCNEVLVSLACKKLTQRNLGYNVRKNLKSYDLSDKFWLTSKSEVIFDDLLYISCGCCCWKKRFFVVDFFLDVYILIPVSKKLTFGLTLK